ncbi:MAG: FKBP-type peptidyl-prolyl cis-trans isomerase [Prevotellaceae bacterium]|jgi:FKBP-type peptidyl-prolyl cis-trans isomerase FklB|nr:FKBP-type peptidyl-prolyl cis-trans isomerase [Prevotellaceae bacterium]
MKKTALFLTAAVALGLTACTAQAPKANLKTDVDTLSYAIGVARTDGLTPYLAQQGINASEMGDFLKGFVDAQKTYRDNDAYMQGLMIGLQVSVSWVKGFSEQVFGSDSTHSISRENLLAGFIDGVKSDTTIMKLHVATTYVQTNMERIKEKALETQYADNKTAGEKFLAENKTKEGVVTTASGLQYKIITKGNGEIPKSTDQVKVNYKGTLIDGTEFDSSYSRNEPTTFRANQVIKGWTEALTLMPVGSKWELYIPQDLGYGARVAGDKIKPFSTLVFEVELLGIEKEQTQKK